MIRFQIIERTGAQLHKTLVEAMRTGELRTFIAKKRGRKVLHKNSAYPGWMNWSVSEGIITCEVLSPNKPGREWQLFSAFLGRLADRYADRIVAINIQFPGSVPFDAPPRRRRSRARRKTARRHRTQPLTAASHVHADAVPGDATRGAARTHAASSARGGRHDDAGRSHGRSCPARLRSLVRRGRCAPRACRARQPASGAWWPAGRRCSRSSRDRITT